ncbi:hypothetical protein HPB47_014010 [Ixodes persulcatus]|uniref:Uncharacterized protein n=1 Tax=Ixodes persulcatus TaxID=34615 RepID=A0AC60QXC9_IXOPE|nr:hypothetical protein HPB47_014010 [Ixodes persulcatus]
MDTTQHSIITTINLPIIIAAGHFVPLNHPSQSPIPDGIRPAPLKASDQQLAPLLTRLFQQFLDTAQLGFRPGRSCETALLTDVHQIIDSLDSSTPCELVQLDITKAFDKVDHKLLITKLESTGAHQKGEATSRVTLLQLSNGDQARKHQKKWEMTDEAIKKLEEHLSNAELSIQEFLKLVQ